jgi:phosphoribosylglycinamide formyltransferase 1
VARLAVLASGNGSNFQAIVERLREAGRHECVLMIYDRKDAFAASRAARLGIPSRYVSYYKRDPREAEAEIAAALDVTMADIVALAGFMRLLSAEFVAPRRGRLVNVHPALLPKWPGAHAIDRAFEAGEREFGVTVHYVDEGMDTGQIISKVALAAGPMETLGDIENRVHAIEHEIFPRAVLGLLDALDEERGMP